MDDNNLNPTADDPISRIFDRVYQMGPREGGVHKLLNAAMGTTARDPQDWQRHLLALDPYSGKMLSAGSGVSKYSSMNLGGLFEDLRMRGMSSNELHGALSVLASKNSAANFFYNKATNALFYESNGKFSPLPLQVNKGGMPGVIHIGAKQKVAPLITRLSSDGRTTRTWTDSYYVALKQALDRDRISDIHKIITNDVLKARIGNLDSPSRLKPVSLNIDKDVIFFDLETTSLDTAKAEILQLGYTKYTKGGGKTSGVFHVMPKGPITGAEIHGITREKLIANNAAPFESYAAEISDLFKNAVVGGFNVKQYDLPILERLLGKTGLGEAGIIDVYEMYKDGPGKLTPHRSAALTTLARRYGYSTAGAHSAKEDVRMSISVLEGMLGEFPTKFRPYVTGLTQQLLRGGFNLKQNNPSLRNILHSPNYRGRIPMFTARAVGLGQVMTGEETHELFQTINKYREAKRAVTQIIKTAGRSLPSDLGIFADLGQMDITPQRLMSRAVSVLEETANKLPGIYSKLGLDNSWPLIKPDKLIDKSNIILPTEYAAKLFNGKFTEGMYNKGVFQLYKLSTLSSSQKRILRSLGDENVADVLSTMTPEFRETVKNSGMKLRVGVLEFNSAAQSRAVFGESGGFYTKRGALKLANQYHTGQVVLNAPSEATVTALENIFNVSLSGPDTIYNINKSLGISEARFNYIMKTKTSKLGQRDKLYKELYVKSGKFRNVLRSQANFNNNLSTITRREGKLVLDFVTSDASVPHTIETVLGLRRHTLSSLDRTHPLSSAADRLASEMGVDVLVSADEASKYYPDLIKDTGMKASIHDLSHLGTSGIHVLNVFGGPRSDFLSDINALGVARMTPGKMRTLALGSLLHGFKDPMDDPMYATIARGWKGRGIGFNNTLDLTLSDSHMARQFARAITGNKIITTEANRIQIRSGNMFVGNKQLAKLPGKDVEEFMTMLSVKSGGIKFSDLAGTVLDKNVFSGNGLYYIDTGAPSVMNFVSNLSVKTQYIPIANDYLRLSKGVNKRLMINRDHSAYNMLKALKMLEVNPGLLEKPLHELSAEAQVKRREFESLIRASTQSVATKLGGKSGLFETTNTIRLPGSVRTRLHAGSSLPNGSLDYLNTYDDVFVSKHELSEILHRRRFLDKKLAKASGFEDVKHFDQVLKHINKQGFTYAMLSADPVQRPEHQRLVRLRVNDGNPLDRRHGVLNLQTSSLSLRKMERDLDRDAMTLHFIEHLGNYKYTEKLEKMYMEQQKMNSLFRWIHMSDLAKEGKTSFSIAKYANAIGMGGFLSQKSFAHLGYSITRPVDSFMMSIISGGAESAASLGIHGNTSVISKIISPFKGDTYESAVAQTLAQNLFQAGVKKGQGSPLVSLASKMTAASESIKSAVKAGNIDDLAGLVTTTYKPIFRELLEATDKHREYGLVPYLMQKAGMSSENIRRVEEDLARGSTEALARLNLDRGVLLDQTAEVLARHYGGGHAIIATADRFSRNTIIGAIQTFRGTIKAYLDRPGSQSNPLLTKILQPLAGESPIISSGEGQKVVAKAIEKAAAGIAVEGSLFERTKAFFKNKETLSAGLIGLGVGFLSHSLLSNNNIASVDSSMPGDYGPDMGGYVNRVKLYDFPTPRGRRESNPARLSNVQKYSYNSVNLNTNVVDNSKSFDPQIARSYMDRIASSDFTY